jgi:hypothetical protein
MRGVFNIGWWGEVAPRWQERTIHDPQAVLSAIDKQSFVVVASQEQVGARLDKYWLLVIASFYLRSRISRLLARSILHLISSHLPNIGHCPQSSRKD